MRDGPLRKRKEPARLIDASGVIGDPTSGGFGLTLVVYAFRDGSEFGGLGTHLLLFSSSFKTPGTRGTRRRDESDSKRTQRQFDRGGR